MYRYTLLLTEVLSPLISLIFTMRHISRMFIRGRELMSAVIDARENSKVHFREKNAGFCGESRQSCIKYKTAAVDIRDRATVWVRGANRARSPSTSSNQRSRRRESVCALVCVPYATLVKNFMLLMNLVKNGLLWRVFTSESAWKFARSPSSIRDERTIGLPEKPTSNIDSITNSLTDITPRKSSSMSRIIFLSIFEKWHVILETRSFCSEFIDDLAIMSQIQSFPWYEDIFCHCSWRWRISLGCSWNSKGDHLIFAPTPRPFKFLRDARTAVAI